MPIYAHYKNTISRRPKKVGAICILGIYIQMLTHRWTQPYNNNTVYITKSLSAREKKMLLVACLWLINVVNREGILFLLGAHYAFDNLYL